MTDPTIPQKEISRSLLAALELRTGHSLDQAFPAHGRAAGQDPVNGPQGNLVPLAGLQSACAARWSNRPSETTMHATAIERQGHDAGGRIVHAGHDGDRRQRRDLQCDADNRLGSPGWQSARSTGAAIQEEPAGLGSLHAETASQIAPKIGLGGSKMHSLKLVPFRTCLWAGQHRPLAGATSTGAVQVVLVLNGDREWSGFRWSPSPRAGSVQ